MKHEIAKELPGRFQVTVLVNTLLLKDGSYLLLRRANTGWADGYFTLPAGHVDGNERLTVAAARAVKEETGINVEPEDLDLVHVMHRSDKEDDRERLDFYFLARQWQGDPYLAEPDKSDQLGWFSLDQLPQKTLEHAHRALHVYQSQLLSEINWEQ